MNYEKAKKEVELAIDDCITHIMGIAKLEIRDTEKLPSIKKKIQDALKGPLGLKGKIIRKFQPSFKIKIKK